MSEILTIQSYKGEYSVHFEAHAFETIDRYHHSKTQFIIDAKVAHLYREKLASLLASEPLIIEATEENKSLNRMPEYVEALVSRGIKKGHTLVAIGGGIIQDIACFLGATLLRGVPWVFYPTTLLAQADSCIGSKSSINVGKIKNIVGTFTPPLKVHLSTEVLKTLTREELHSGAGEMLKVHIIDGSQSFDKIASAYDTLFDDEVTLTLFIKRSLEIKKGLIEQDEFDVGIRNILNYGHSFGHAIESATNFGIPHGIAVTIGMDMANFIAASLHFTPMESYHHMHTTLQKNYKGYESYSISTDALLQALKKDKKNTESELVLILPDKDVTIEKRALSLTDQFRELCELFLERERRLI